MAIEINRPMIQADDVFREMTADEYAEYLAMSESNSSMAAPNE